MQSGSSVCGREASVSLLLIHTLLPPLQVVPL